MAKLNIPKVRSIREGEFVTVPSEAWKSLKEAINYITETIEHQQATIDKLVGESNTAREDITKIAEILKEIYDNV
jgi:hypothetical protein